MQNILLAAGLATRSGGEKLLLPYRGKPIIAHAVEQSLAAGLYTIVVTGFRREEIEQALLPYACSNLRLLYNSDYALGQGSSTQVGATALRPGEDFFISLADMPLITAQHYWTLMRCFSSSIALRPLVKGTVGHPVLLQASFKTEIVEQQIPFTMQALLQEFHVEHYEVDDEAYILDIDTMDSYAELLVHPRPY